jgi:hypothetical protein
MQDENRFLWPEAEKRLGNRIAQASISRAIQDPMEGNWVIKINSINAMGDFYIDTNLKIFQSIITSKYISGNIKDEKNRPVKGATVLMKGLTMSVVSDRDGYYYIPVYDYINEIVFIKKGMITKEVNVEKAPLWQETNINVTLERENL